MITVLLFVLVTSKVIPVATCAIGLILAGLAFVLRPYDKAYLNKVEDKISSQKSFLASLKLKESEIATEYANISAKLNAINTALNSSIAVIEKQQQLLNESLSSLNSLNEEKSAEEIRLLAEYGKYATAENAEQVIASLETLTQKTAAQKELKQQLNFVLNDLNGISYEEAQRKLDAVKESDISLSENFEELKLEYEKILADITERKAQIAALTAEIRSALSSAEDTEQLKKQFAELKEKTDKQKEFCLCADIASTVLSESFGELRRSFGSVLEKKAGGIFEGLTDSKYSSMSISKSLDINVEKSGEFGNREIDYLSSGTADQAYLSLRLALTELMCKDSELLPVFLDDALTQYDDSRMKTAVEFLKKYSENTQVIMFTCHNSVVEVSKEMGADCKNLAN